MDTQLHNILLSYLSELQEDWKVSDKNCPFDLEVSDDEYDYGDKFYWPVKILRVVEFSTLVSAQPYDHKHEPSPQNIIEFLQQIRWVNQQH